MESPASCAVFKTNTWTFLVGVEDSPGPGPRQQMDFQCPWAVGHCSWPPWELFWRL